MGGQYAGRPGGSGGWVESHCLVCVFVTFGTVIWRGHETVEFERRIVEVKLVRCGGELVVESVGWRGAS